MKKNNTGGFKETIINYSLNGFIILLLLATAYLGFSLINNSINANKDKEKNITDTNKAVTNQPNLSIQLDVQNGTSENGVAGKFREYLIRNGLDVVDMGNYKSQDMERTLIIDRAGNKAKAKRVASVLGVSEKNIIQQLNNSLFLDVTVVIGRDFKELKPYLEKTK